jgi:protease I
MSNILEGKKVAILATDGVEQIEFTDPKEQLEKQGAQVYTVSIKEGKIKGWDHDHWDKEFTVDKLVSEVKAEDYHALVLPGGQINPDKLRADQNAVNFVRSFFGQGKPVAAICHGPWLLAEADVLKDRTITSYPSIKTDMKNAGAHWVDEEVVVDSGLVTSRKPDDLPAFCKKMIEEICEGVHEEQAA